MATTNPDITAFLIETIRKQQQEAAEKKEEGDGKEGGAASTLSSLAGLGGLLGGAIPGLKKGGRQRKALLEQQAGKGAGALLAQQVGKQAAANALSIAGSGRGATRGLALKQGLRSAERAIGEGAAQAGQIAAAESQAATQALRQNDLIRNRNISQFGGELGAGLSALGAGIEANKQKREGEEEQGDVLGKLLGTESPTGVGSGQAGGQSSQAPTPPPTRVSGPAPEIAPTPENLQQFPDLQPFGQRVPSAEEFEFEQQLLQRAAPTQLTEPTGGLPNAQAPTLDLQGVLNLQKTPQPLRPPSVRGAPSGPIQQVVSSGKIPAASAQSVLELFSDADPALLQRINDAVQGGGIVPPDIMDLIRQKLKTHSGPQVK